MCRYLRLNEAYGSPGKYCLVYVWVFFIQIFNEGAIFCHDGLQVGLDMYSTASWYHSTAADRRRVARLALGIASTCLFHQDTSSGS